jgi:ATP-dependent DNA helicase RecG
MELEEIVAGGETLTVEFKRQLSDRDLWEAVVCLANGHGGTLLIGVDDDGTICGAHPRHGDHTSPDRLAAAIQNNIEPPLGVTVDLLPHEDKEVIAVRVPQSLHSPVGTRRGLYVKRVVGADGAPACMPMPPQELWSRSISLRGMDYALAPAEGATFADLDPDEFSRFRRLCQTTRGDSALTNLGDRDIPGALGLAPIHGHVSLGMILLFGREEALSRWVPTAEVLFQDSRSNGLAANEEMRLPLFKAAEELERRMRLRNTTTEVYVGSQRVDIPLLPPIVHRESIANALVHRDYAQLGPIQVQLTDDTFTVTSPGSFPPGVTIANMLDQTRPRSQALALAFKRAGLVERRGKGINEMFESQLRAGKGIPDYSASSPVSVSASVPLASDDINLVRFIARWQSEENAELSLDELRVIHEIHRSGPCSVEDLMALLGLTEIASRGATRRLTEHGLLESRGRARRPKFHLTAAFYERSEDRAAYIRLRDIEPHRQEAMILDYVQTYGRITRSEAARLCQTSPNEARTLLKGLVVAGQLELRGERRGAHYVLREGTISS